MQLNSSASLHANINAGYRDFTSSGSISTPICLSFESLHKAKSCTRFLPSNFSFILFRFWVRPEGRISAVPHAGLVRWIWHEHEDHDVSGRVIGEWPTPLGPSRTRVGGTTGRFPVLYAEQGRGKQQTSCHSEKVRTRYTLECKAPMVKEFVWQFSLWCPCVGLWVIAVQRIWIFNDIVHSETSSSCNIQLILDDSGPMMHSPVPHVCTFDKLVAFCIISNNSPSVP